MRRGRRTIRTGLNTLVVGPWNHGGWSRGIGDRLGPIKFDQPTAWQFREKIEVPFFAHYLKDRPLVLDKDDWRTGARMKRPGPAVTTGCPK